MRYTAAQSAAIRTIDGNHQIVAGPGSGKSGTLSARSVKCVTQSGVGPENVVITYNEDAANSLRQRIHALAAEKLPDTTGLAAMFIGTFHGFCLSLLLETEYLTAEAARSIERRDLPRLPMFCSTCEQCDHVDVCPTRYQRP